MNGVEQHPTKWAIPFFTIWTGQQLSLIGSSLAQFALIWWVTKTTGSATVLATATAVALLPNIFLGPLAGALVDRWSRRVVMIVADGVVALASAVLLLLFRQGTIQVWHVYVIMLIRAIGSTFHWPAMTASTPLMVPKEHLSRVAGLNQAIGGGVNIISPPLGALLLSLLPMYEIMAIDVMTAAFAITPLFFIFIPQPPRTARTTGDAGFRPTLWADMREGFHYVWNWPGLKALILLSLILNFLVNPPMELLPILVTRHFGGAALRLGWMNSSWGVGLVVGGLILSAWGGFRRRIVTTLVGVVGLGLGILLIGIAPSSFFALALIGLFFGAVMNSMSNAALMALLQQAIVPEMQGRVWALGGSLAGAAMPLGLAIAGPLADTIGVRALYIVSGILYILLGVGAFFVQAIMHIEDNRRVQVVVEG
jgi:DHA3 family macrolide efflux protein-like MFS transporter